MTANNRRVTAGCRMLRKGDVKKARQRTGSAAWASVGLLMAAALCGSDAADAQQFNIGSNNPNVFVNTDLLNSLGPGGFVPYPTYQGGAGFAGGYAGGYGGQFASPQPGSMFLTRPGTLLFPPNAYPRSQLINRGATVALTAPSNQVPAAGGTIAQLKVPKLTSPSAPAVADVPRAEEPKDQGGTALAPPPPVPASSATEMAEAAAPESSSSQTALDSVPAPPELPTSEAMVQDPDSEPQVAPPPPPEDTMASAGGKKAEGTTGGAESETSMAEVPPPPGSDAGEEASASEAEAEAPAQEAVLPPADLAESELRLLFSPGKAELSDEVKGELRKLAEALTSDGNARVQLLAYATSSDDSASRARRLSLSRALAVRAYLIDQGVRSTRMDVRALGDKAEQEPKDRVDIQPARR